MYSLRFSFFLSLVLFFSLFISLYPSITGQAIQRTPQSITLPCGASITANTTLSGDIICSSVPYTFVLSINQPDVTLDCRGHRIANIGNIPWGINVNSPRVTIKNCIIENFTWGISVYSNAHQSTLEYNTLRFNIQGISLSSWQNFVSSNIFVNNTSALFGGRLSQFIANSIFGGSSGMALDSQHIVKHNSFYAVPTAITTNGNISLYYNNTFVGFGIVGISLGGNYNIISKNTFINYSTPVSFSQYSSYNTFTENIGFGTGFGLSINGRNHIVTHNILHGPGTRGVHLSKASSTTLLNNTLLDFSTGIYLISSNFNTLRSNILLSTSSDIRLSRSHHNAISLHSSSSPIPNGLELTDSYYTSVFNNIFANKIYCFNLGNSSYTTLSSNQCLDSKTGAEIRSSSHSVFSNNIFSNYDSSGFRVYSYGGYPVSFNLSFVFNCLKDSTGSPFYFSSMRDNTIASNIMRNLTGSGVYLSYNTLRNKVYNNYFVGNAIDGKDEFGTNFWNTTVSPGQNIIGGSYFGGNFWQNYSGVDVNGDLLGDTLVPYTSQGNIISGGDYHPLLQTTPLPQPIFPFVC